MDTVMKESKVKLWRSFTGE